MTDNGESEEENKGQSDISSPELPLPSPTSSLSSSDDDDSTTTTTTIATTLDISSEEEKNDRLVQQQPDWSSIQPKGYLIDTNVENSRDILPWLMEQQMASSGKSSKKEGGKSGNTAPRRIEEEEEEPETEEMFEEKLYDAWMNTKVSMKLPLPLQYPHYVRKPPVIPVTTNKTYELRMEVRKKRDEQRAKKERIRKYRERQCDDEYSSTTVSSSSDVTRSAKMTEDEQKKQQAEKERKKGKKTSRESEKWPKVTPEEVHRLNKVNDFKTAIISPKGSATTPPTMAPPK